MATCQVLNCRLTDDSGGELYNVAIKDGVIAAIELASAGGGACECSAAPLAAARFLIARQLPATHTMQRDTI